MGRCHLSPLSPDRWASPVVLAATSVGLICTPGCVKDASTSHPEWVTKGAKFATIDYNDRSTLLAAFEGVEVAISAVRSTPESLQGQKALAEAAKSSGAKIFAPSEFGTPGGSGGYVALKREIHEYLREIELPYAIFYTGPCSDMLFCP